MIDGALNLQAGACRGRGNQLHDGYDQWLAAPVLRDEREQPVLDLVPLAGAGRQMTDGDGHAEFVGQRLQFALPQPHASAIAAATISSDQQAAGFGITRPPHGLPPAPDGVDREARGVVVDADTDPAGIAGDVVDAIRHGAAEFRES